MSRDIEEVVSQMTLEEKAALCSGFDFWHTKGIERLGIPSIMMTDGPHGLRKQSEKADHLGLNESIPATCFPTASALACSWDKKLIERVGAAIGEECRAEGVSILLGPGVNIKRSPLCGRNFEYFSEDPYLSSEMAANFINGVQSKGVGTSLKHYAVNNQEHLRMTIDAVIDERTLREIYLASFEGAVKKSQPWTVMCAYNKVNGGFCSENKYLLTDILKEEWGFEGFVVSDWGAVNNRVDGLIAGLELEMPSCNYDRDKKIVEAVRNGILPEDTLNRAVERILKVIFKAVDNKKENVAYDKEEHHKLAKEAARESMVLLKNDDNILPMKKSGTLAIIGSFAKSPRYQGGGSSHIIPSILDNAYAEIIKYAGSDMKILYAEGYRLDETRRAFSNHEFISNSDYADESLIDEAKEIAQKADFAVIFAGLPESYESEGFDRKHLRIPEGHRKLIEAVSEVQKSVIVVLNNGAPIEMPWLDNVKGVLEGYLGGQAFGGAAVDLLFGNASPCGKLAETFPRKLCHNPSYLYYPGNNKKVEYNEGIFVGYRYYDSKEVEPLFPFGYGLSYTKFEYTDIYVDNKKIYDNEKITVCVNVKNTGNITGKEIIQLYVSDVESGVIRPLKELKGFEKIELQPGEEKTVSFTLGKRSFAYYDESIKDWYVENGEFEILVGKSSREIVLSERVLVLSTTVIARHYTRNTTVGEILAEPEKAEILKESLKGMGELFEIEESGNCGSLLREMPLRSIVSFNEVFSEEKLEEILCKLNNM